MAARKCWAGRPWGAWLIGVAIIATGCAQPQPAAERAPQASPDPQAVAAGHLSSGRFEAAAAAYAALAAGAPEPTATRARLKSALLRIDLREATASELPAAPLPDPALESLRVLGAAASALETGDPTTALGALEALTQAAFDSYERGLYLRTLGRAQLASGQALPASLNLLAAESRPMPGGRRGELTHAIWDALNAAGVTAVRTGAPAEAPHAAGWFALAEAYTANAYEPASFAAALAGWQKQYPQHPAQDILVAELLERSEEAASAPTKIALLLPLEGPLAEVAATVRDGFLAMRFSGVLAPAPEILVYSVTAGNVSAKLAEAVAAGADFAVGPLEKAALDALLAAGPPPVPTLALNTSSRPVTAGGRLYQFGLRPEDEAIDAAERAWRDGHRRMVVMTPANDLGWRVASAFEARWQALGGAIVDQVRFQSSVDAYAAAVRQVFGLRQSEARAAALRALLHRAIVSEPRRRDDVDAVLLTAPPVEARQILPQFRYFGADDLPTYATSSVYGGSPNPGADQDLDGVMFGDSPWLLGAGTSSLERTFRTHWRGDSEHLRFFAFGADAFRIIPYLAQLRSQPGMRVDGGTGRLYVEPDGLVRRSLTWARFALGRPQLLGAAPP